MRYYVDSWEKICDHNGVIGASNEYNLEFVSRLLTEQAGELKRLQKIETAAKEALEICHDGMNAMMVAGVESFSFRAVADQFMAAWQALQESVK